MYNIGMERQDRVSSSLGSGFPKDSIILIEGEQGSGKSVWLQRFSKGFCEEGYNISYVSSEMNLRSLLEQMNSINYSITENIILKGNFDYYQVDIDTERKLDTYMKSRDKKRIILPNLVSEGSKSIWNSNIVIIDNIGFILKNDPYYQDSSDKNKYKIIRNFVSFLKSISKKNVCIILSINPKNIQQRVIDHFRKRFNINLRLQIHETETDISRQMIVNKYQRAEDEVDNIIRYKIQSKRGITIETSTVV